MAAPAERTERRSHGAYDALIVGAGISGTALALAAARRGWRVAVLDASPRPDHLPYPEVLWASSMAFLDDLGVGAAIRQRTGTLLRDVEIRSPRGRRLLRLSPADLARADAHGCSTDASETRRLLMEAATRTGEATFVGGVRVHRLLREAGRVVGVEGVRDGERVRLRAPLIFAADGDHSTVREQAGLPLPAKRFPLDFLVAEVRRPGDLPPGKARVHLDPEGFRTWPHLVATLLIPLPANRVGLVLFTKAGACAEPMGEDALLGRLERLEPGLAEGASARPSLQCTPRSVGHAPTYGRDNVVLLGDAAHPASPVGGQGANMAIADVAALDGTVLRCDPRDPSSLRAAVSAYAAARWSPNEAGLADSRRASSALELAFRAPRLGQALPLVLRGLDLLRPLKAKAFSREIHAYVNSTP